MSWAVTTTGTEFAPTSSRTLAEALPEVTTSLLTLTVAWESETVGVRKKISVVKGTVST